MVNSKPVKLAALYMLYTIFMLSMFIVCVFEFANCVVLDSCDSLTLAFDVSHSATLLTFRGVSGVHGDLPLLLLALTFAVIIWFAFTLQRISHLITALINLKEYESTFQHKLQSTISQMKNMNISENLQSTVVQYILLDWTKREEYHKQQIKECVNSLPDIFRVELCTEMYWPALKHSQLFHSMDLAFLRCVAEKMYMVHMYPGELLYEKGYYKHKMIYVSSGVVEILSQKYGDTPVLSLSAGTCLGEATLFIGYPSTVSLRCKEYGQIYILRMTDLVQILSYFPEQYRKLKAIAVARYETAKKLNMFTDVLDDKFKAEQKTCDMALMWLTSTLHRLMAKSGSESEIHECQNIYLREEIDEDRFSLHQFLATYLNLLAITERVSMFADSVFVKYECPPILQPDSVIRFTWDLTICFVTFFFGLLSPFLIALPTKIPLWYLGFVAMLTVLYIFDVYITVTTAVRQHNCVISNIVGIVQYNVTLVSFWIDIFAALPFELLTHIVLRTYNINLMLLLHTNRLTKLISVILLIGKFEKHLPSHAALIRRFKNSLPYFYVSYIASCVLFRAEADVLDLTVNKLPEYIRYGFQICATVGLEQTNRVVQSTYINYFVIVFLILFLYGNTISKYASESILVENDLRKFRDICLNVTSTANAFNITQSCQKRIERYFRTQWQYDKALLLMYSTTLLKELPPPLYQSIMEDLTTETMRNIRLFDDLTGEVLFNLCSTVRMEVLPPKEVICYTGSPHNCFYCIVDGYVETYYSNKTKLSLGPKSCILEAEACLNLPVPYTCVTSTHCKLLTFSVPRIVSILSKAYNEVNITDTNPLFAEIRTKLKTFEDERSVFDIKLDLQEYSGSFRHFGYNLKIDSEEEYEYFVPFDRCGTFSFVRNFLMRTTILPFGNFLFCWEIVRSICAILSATLFVINPVVTCWECDWRYFLYFLDLMAWIDIYVRFHVCYYNDKGILITHPLKTACHYATHAFTVDVIAAFPILFLFSPNSTKAYKLFTVMHWVKILQLYRYLGLIKTIAVPDNSYYKIVVIFKYIPLLLVFCNTLASIVCNIDCDFHESIKNDLFENGVECDKDSFFLVSFFQTPLSRIGVHVISFMFMIRWLTTSGMVTSEIISLTDFFITIGSIICGFILHISLLIAFISTFCTTGTVLSHYQKALKSLKSFLKKEKVDKIIQNEIIRHYELKWRLNCGRQLTEATKKLSKNLQEDIVYSIFGRMLTDCSVFTYGNRESFFRAMVLEAHHEAITAGTTVCFVNQIISKMYILCKGTVEVIAPDGTKLTTLKKGSFFGNLDDYSRVRQTISIRTESDCEVLVIDSKEFHTILRKFPHLHKRFKLLTIMHIDYLPGREMDESKENKNSQIHRFALYTNLLASTKKPLFVTIWRFCLFFLIYFSTAFQVYMQFLLEYNLPMLLFLYFCDVLYIINFSGECINVAKNSFKAARQSLLYPRVVTKFCNCSSVILFLLDSFPFDIAAWLLDSDARYEFILFLRFNRILRIRYFFDYFQQFEKRLYVSHNLTKMLQLFTLISLILHIMGCVLTSASCTDPPNYTRDVDCGALKFTDSKHIEKLVLYLQHLYVAGTCFLLGTQYHYYPTSVRICIYHSVGMLMSAFLFTISSAYVVSVMRSEDYALITYQANYRSLKNYMESENVSSAVVNKVCNYVRCMWKAHKGPIFPEMLVKAPTTLKMQVMNFCFSHEVRNHPIFKKCHKDFLKQLVLTIEVNEYFYGDYIAFKGDINACMYFIHKGKVEILLEDTASKSDVLDTLHAGQAFGVLQGLYSNKPHEYYFKSVNKTVILILKKSSWEYLLDFFPASKEVIFNTAEAYYSF